MFLQDNPFEAEARVQIPIGAHISEVIGEKMIDEYALREAFSKIKQEMDEIKKEIRSLNEKLNNMSNEDYTEELIEVSNNPINKETFEEEINLTDSYY